MTAQTATSLTCADVEEMLAAYAVGALESDEQIAVDRHLSDCRSCRQALAAFDEAVLALATLPAPSPPPDSLRSRLLTEIQTPGAPVPIQALPAVARAAAPRNLVIPRWLVAATSIAAAILIASVAVLATLLADARSDRNGAASAAQKLSAYLAAGGDAMTLSVPALPENEHYYGRGSLVVAPDLPPLVVVNGCAPTDKNRRYRVWLARGEDRTPVGELTVDGDGGGWIEVTPAEPLTTYDTIGITMVGADSQRWDLLVGPVQVTTTA